MKNLVQNQRSTNKEKQKKERKKENNGVQKLNKK